MTWAFFAEISRHVYIYSKRNVNEMYNFFLIFHHTLLWEINSVFYSLSVHVSSIFTSFAIGNMKALNLLYDLECKAFLKSTKSLTKVLNVWRSFFSKSFFLMEWWDLRAFFQLEKYSSWREIFDSKQVHLGILIFL